MSLLTHPRVAVAGALAVLVTGCGGAAVAAPPPAPTAAAAAATTVPAAPTAAPTAPTATPAAPTTTPTATPAAPTATPARRASARTPARSSSAIDGVTALAMRQYAAEVHGPLAKTLLHRVAGDKTLLRTLQSGNLTATRAYIARQFPAVWYHWHVSRMRIVQGSRVVDETGVPFVVAPAQMTLRGTGGRSLGTLQISIQDEIGFVRLMHRNHGVDVVVRGQSAGHMRTSLPAAANASLPSRGSTTIAGTRYQVRSFNETAWAGEPVTVWILARG
jgi:hypothetical protein